jgi:hypothetical protein
MTGIIDWGELSRRKDTSSRFSAWCDDCGAYLKKAGVGGEYFQVESPAENALIIHCARIHKNCGCQMNAEQVIEEMRRYRAFLVGTDKMFGKSVPYT